jgi:hypothetical protein
MRINVYDTICLRCEKLVPIDEGHTCISPKDLRIAKLVKAVKEGKYKPTQDGEFRAG